MNIRNENQNLRNSIITSVKPFILSIIFVQCSFAINVYGQSWDQIKKVVASDRGAEDIFGRVAISGDYAIVGAQAEDEDATGGNTLSNAGAAYILKKNAGTWTLVQKIVASDRGANDSFGHRVAISGDYVIVSSMFDDEDATGGNTLGGSGSSYIFQNIAGTWLQVKKIVASDRDAGDTFGSSVAISGTYAIVGARSESEDASGENTLDMAGSAYVFKNNNGNWNQVQKIVASERGASDWFGWSVAMSGDYAIIGAQREDHDVLEGNMVFEAGSAYIFHNVAGTWSQVQKIVASDRGSQDRFGWDVAISDNHAIVGAYWEDEDLEGANHLTDAGSAYIFKNFAGSWLEIQKIVASDRGYEDFFGHSVAISGDYIVVGAMFEDEGTPGSLSFSDAGSAYIYRNVSGNWTEVQKIAAEDREDYDWFGTSVAISADYVFVGALNEDEDALGGNSISNAGSVYIFENFGGANEIVENSFSKSLSIYPNPTDGNFSIDLGTIYQKIQIEISDISGKMIDSKSSSQSQIINISLDNPAGIYLISIQADDQKATLRLVKE